MAEDEEFPSPVTGMCQLTPNAVLRFDGPRSEKDEKIVKVQNQSKEHVLLYKMKCTCNDKFRLVNCGNVVQPKESGEITVERRSDAEVLAAGGGGGAAPAADNVDKFRVFYLLVSQEGVRQAGGNAKHLWRRATAQGARQDTIKLVGEHGRR